MVKGLLTILVNFLLVFAVHAQQALEIKGQGNDLYLEHAVAAQENFYSIGRNYNASPRDIAEFNNLPLDDGLNVGQSLKIPLGPFNFTQELDPNAFEALVPIYHTVQSGETLFRLGANYSNVSLEKIKKWNRLQSDGVEAGSRLIIGFLKVNENESAFAEQRIDPKSLAINTQTVNTQPEPQPEPEPEIKTVVEEEQGNTEEPEAPVVDEVVVKRSESTVVPITPNMKFNGGYFKNNFDRQMASDQSSTIQGSAAMFKSTSGWKDGKYYCFNNEALPGTIVRITNRNTGRTIYAKVLDTIPEIRRNEGLSLVLSNSATDALGIADSHFECTITYFPAG